MDRDQLADFLRTRRAALTPADAGLPDGARRRTAGLRREEVAQLAGMSADYYTRLEQRRGPQPSEQMLTALARALRLTLAERDHLFRIAGRGAPDRRGRADHVSGGMLRIVDRLADTPAMVLTEAGETLVQTPPAVALLGDQTAFTGLARSTLYRWYTMPDSRNVYPFDDQPLHERVFTGELRAAFARGGARAAEIVAALTRESAEFRARWAAHDVEEKQQRVKRIQHPELGVITVECESLFDTEAGQRLLVFTAAPGSADAEKLQLLTVIGAQRF